MVGYDYWGLEEKFKLTNQSIIVWTSDSILQVTGFRPSPDLMLEEGKASLEFSVIVFSGVRKKPTERRLAGMTEKNLSPFVTPAEAGVQ